MIENLIIGGAHIICARLSRQTVRLRIVELTELISGTDDGPLTAAKEKNNGWSSSSQARTSGRQAGAGDVRRRARRGQTVLTEESRMKNPFK